LANENARALRKRLTPQEVKLWTKLRELKALGLHIRRQAPIGPYIVDFVCFRCRLVIEADGGQHGLPEGTKADHTRDAFLVSQGFRVLRFWNSDVNANLAGVMESILNALSQPQPTGLRPATLPTRGRDKKAVCGLGPIRRSHDCLTGKSSICLSSPLRKNISVRRSPKSLHYSRRLVSPKGRIAIVTDAG
jgi:very-short-patch-repair endonuclease